MLHKTLHKINNVCIAAILLGCSGVGALKIQRWQQRAGSIPAPGTK